MSKTKMTKREKFELLANLADVKASPILSEFVAHELELLAKKNASGSGKMTASQIANEKIKASILECMANEPTRLFTITDMIKAFDCCRELSLPKVTALVGQLVKSELVERLEEKRKAYFRIVQ